MKLIITNRPEFESFFNSPNLDCFPSKDIHKFAFQKLQQSLAVNNSIPLMIFQNIDLKGWRDAEFRLVAFKQDLCFFEFHGVIS
jgi:hypothetical protein